MSKVTGSRLQVAGCLKNGLLIITCLFLTCQTFSQIIDADTSSVVIRKTKKAAPDEYNISDVIVKIDKSKDKYKNVIRVDLDIPLKTTMRLAVSDTSGAKLMYLINDQTLSPGVYRVKWEMTSCANDTTPETNIDCLPRGKYLCEFETDHFIFQRDFYIK